MIGIPLASLLGIATGFLVCIPPGPINVSILREATLARIRTALLIAAGGAAADCAISLCAALGVSWLLGGVLANRWVRCGFAIFLTGYGIGILVSDRRRPAVAQKPPFPPSVHGPLAVGLLQGLANPALIVNWGLIVAFLASHRMLAGGVPASGPAAMSAFAAGVGLGGFLWYALLVWLVHALREHGVGRWLRESVVLAGVLLVLMGVYFTARTVIGAR